MMAPNKPSTMALSTQAAAAALATVLFSPYFSYSFIAAILQQLSAPNPVFFPSFHRTLPLVN